MHALSHRCGRFLIANVKTLPGIAAFAAAEAAILNAKRFCRTQNAADGNQQRNTITVIASISILISLMGIVSMLNHILNTGESLAQPVCIALFGAAAAWISFRNRG